MDASKRIVTTLPLKELWDDRGPISAKHRRNLSRADVRELLRHGPVQFVVADVGKKLDWVPADNCYEFWKSDVLIHLAEPMSKLQLEAVPQEYAYLASEWGADGSSLVVLQRYH